MSRLQAMADRGTPRGADRVFHEAERQAEGTNFAVPEVRSRLPLALTALAAAVVVVVAAGYLVLPEQETPVEALADPSNTATAPSLREGVVQDALAVWPGPLGELEVYQATTPDGQTVESVLAVAVSSPTERTVLDQLHGNSDSAQVLSVEERRYGTRVVEWVTVESTALDTFGSFTFARWTDSAANTVTVAWYGITDSQAERVVQTVSTEDGTPTLDAEVVPPQMTPIKVDPRYVPVTPNGTELWGLFDTNSNGVITIGISTSEWPPAAEVLWWNNTARLVDASTLISDDGTFLYQTASGRTVIIETTEPVPDDILQSIADHVRSRSVQEWRQDFMNAPSDNHRVATTTMPEDDMPEGD